MADDRLADVLRWARASLLDFDGPVCSVFASYSAGDGGTVAAAHARRARRAGGRTATRCSAIRDPVPPAVVRRIEQELHDAEMETAETAPPTPEATDLLHAAHGIPVAIVSNNTADAVRGYPDRTDLAELVRQVEVRDPERPAA
jgi:beta-phosphoglucomutase-like phosphatase (HAD superfamily)